MSRVKKLVATVMAFSALMATAGSASAFEEVRNRSFGESYGNDYLYGGFTYGTTQRNFGGNTIYNGFRLESSASQYVDTTVKLFGRTVKPVVLNLRADSQYTQFGTGVTGSRARSVSGSVVVLGATQWSSVGTNCGTGRCLAATKTYEKTLVEGQADIPIGPFSVTVKGKAIGTLTAGYSATADALPLSGNARSLDGSAKVTATGGAAITAQMEGCFGVLFYCVLEIAGNLKVFSIDVSPNVSSTQQSVYDGNANYQYVNRGGINMETMSGSAKLKVNYLFDSWEEEIVDWDAAYAWEGQLWGNSGSKSCNGYLTKPFDCISLVN